MKRQMMRRAWAWVLVLLLLVQPMLSGCHTQETPPETKETKASQPATTEPEAPPEPPSAEELFDELDKELFRELLTLTPYGTKMTLDNPEAYGVPTAEPSFGDEMDSPEYYDLLRDAQQRLKAIDKQELPEKKRIQYETLKAYLSDQLATEELDSYLTSAFSPGTGIQANLPMNLAFFAIHSEADAQWVLELTKQTGDYLDECREFELERLEKGYSLSKTGLETAISQCQSYLDEEPDCVVVGFERSLRKLDLPEETVTDYVAQMQEAVDTFLRPGMERVIETLKTIQEADIAPKSLYELEGGQDYYEWLLWSYVGVTENVYDIGTDAENLFNKTLMEFSTLYQKNPAAFETPVALEVDSPEEMINLLIERSKENFPDAGEFTFQVDELPESMKDVQIRAAYMVPQLDRMDNQVVVNRPFVADDGELFNVLAHESAPGHFYQINYSARKGCSLMQEYMQRTNAYLGYNEGWATYVQNEYAFGYAGMSEDQARMSGLSQVCDFGLLSLIDLLINGLGADREYIAQFGTELGIPDTDAIYDQMLDDPGLYLTYYLGYMKIMELKQTAKKQLGSDFDEVAFHEFFLDAGLTRFDVLEKALDRWLEKA